MYSFDMATATLLVSVLYLVMPTFTWFVLGEARNRAAALWCVGGLATAMATFMISTLSGGPSPTLSLSIPTFLYMFSYSIRAQSLRMELGMPYATRYVVLALIGSTVIFEYLHRVVGLYVPRAMFASFAFSAGAALMTLNAIRISQAEKSKMARWIAMAYGAVALAFLFRLVYLSQQDLSRVQGNGVTDGPASIIAATVMLLSSVIGHFGYVGLFLERSLRQSVLSADEQARTEVSQQLGAQIAVLERRQSLGEMAASIGHELNQPLTAILANAQLVKRGLQTGRMAIDAALPHLEKIELNTQRASGILERIRNFMRAGTVQRDRVNLHEVAHSVLQLLETDLASHGVHIELSATDKTLYVRGDSLELSQVLLNLLKNAVDSMSSVTERRIRVTLDVVDGQARIQVRDTGIGLSEEQLPKAGTPFFTTKQQGLGMGLAISRSIMRKHGGNLTLTNADDGGGSGALAMMELPLEVQAAT